MTFFEKVQVIVEKCGLQAQSSEDGEAVEVMNGSEKVCTVGDSFGIIHRLSPRLLDFVGEICDVQAGLNSEVKLENAEVSEPSIIPFFKEVTRLAEGQGLTTALNESSHSILDIYLGDFCIAHVDGYSGAAMYHNFDLVMDILEDIGDARLRIPFENDEARERERLAALEKSGCKAGQDELQTMSL